MMQSRYRLQVRRIDRKTGAQVLKMLGVSLGRKRGPNWLFDRLDKSGHDQADLVLCLLRLNQLRHVEKLMGHRITHCPCAYRWRPLPGMTRDNTEDGRRVVRVASEFRLRSGRMAWLPRYQNFKVGASVAQLLRRGVRRGDLRKAQKRGWIELSAAA
jgi:hypothetical protein